MLAASVLANGLASKSLVMADGDNGNAVQMQAEILVSKGKAQAPEIAKILFNDMDGWGTCDSFGDNFSRITKYNVINVLKAYKKEHSNGLLHDIAREYELGGLDLNERISYIKKIKTMVLDFIKERNPNLNTKELSDQFDKELQEQSESFGRMDATGLDSIINSAILKYDVQSGVETEDISPDVLLNEFHSIKSDFDAANWISKINANSVKNLLESTQNGNINTLVANIIRSDKISTLVKSDIVEQLLSKVDDSEQKVNIITNFLHSGLDENIDFNFEKIINMLDAKDLSSFLGNYDRISQAQKQLCYTNFDMNPGGRGGPYHHSEATQYFMTFPQAIINADNIPVEKRRKMLTMLIDKASELDNGVLSPDKKERYIKDAKQLVADCEFKRESNADLLFILIGVLKTPSGKFFKDDFDAILKRYNYEL